MEASILRFFENLRCGAATVFAGAFSLFGETLVLVALIAVIYWLVDKDLGERLVFVSFSSLTLNAFLKGTVSRLRPYAKGTVTRVEIDTPFLSTMNLEYNMSFPSGHSQMSGGLFTTVAFRLKKVWAWILALLFLLLVMCSRMYLGVHYPTDVLTGALFGIGFACLWELIYRKAYSRRILFAGIFSALSLILLFISPNKSLAELSGALCATTLAVPLEGKFVRSKIEKGWRKKLFRVLVGGACIGVVFGLFAILPDPSVLALFYAVKWLKYFCLLAISALLAPFLFVKLKI